MDSFFFFSFVCLLHCSFPFPLLAVPLPFIYMAGKKPSSLSLSL